MKPDYSLDFQTPALPRVGDYLSIQRPDHPPPYGEDVIVRRIWWRFDHPTTDGFVEKPETGTLKEILVECDPALSPYSSDQWRKHNQGAPEFEVERFSIGEARLREAEGWDKA
ncbi:hypothetical protein [Qipengyuania sp.]|uniref:hypothetical protein n=1 Tax=Qipengyuania sp. TaxID=2004515 RepID=UPI0035117D76